MKHNAIFIDLSEWIEGDASRRPSTALAQFISYLVERGYRSFEGELAALLQDFVGHYSDQNSLSGQSSSKIRAVVRPTVYITLLRRDGVFIFLDIEPSLGEPARIHAELDIFAASSQLLLEARESIVDDAMKCFGLTKSKEELLTPEGGRSLFKKRLEGQLTISAPLNNTLFQRLKEKVDRNILVELKKRGSILERDLAELPLGGIPTERVKTSLDYFSGQEYSLVDRKHALVCQKTNEIIFLLRERKDLDGAKHLECPKCSGPIGNEAVYAYYEKTDKLKELLDGNRWMPLLVQDALISAGVPENDIFVEVKYGEDEIDVLVFYRGRVFVVEVKDRPMSINDAYKLSAKTSRLESVATKNNGVDIDLMEYFAGEYSEFAAGVGRRTFRGKFIPIAISTHDIAKDAKDLLLDTREAARTLEQCENKLQAFVTELVEELNVADLRTRLRGLSSMDNSDSVSNLTAVQVEHALMQWQKAGQEDG